MEHGMFADDAELKLLLKQLREECKGKRFSDIVDDEERQYVDLVMEGGGMLGIALVGYTYVLEEMGVRFLGIGGTSAGSINAMLLAALGAPAERKSPALLRELTSKRFYDFVDGDSDARDLTDAYVSGAGRFKLAFKAAQVIDNLNNDIGLHPGNAFLEWIAGILQGAGIKTVRDLKDRMNVVPKGLRVDRQDGSDPELLDTPEKAGARLAIVAADVSTETKVVFPEMANLYWAEPEQVNPACFVRASMSIPYFFHPYCVNSLPQGVAARQRWEAVGFFPEREGGVPRNAMFVDGGVMSNFPIDIFHDPECVPAAPTFGVKLEYDRRRREIDGPIALFGAIFNSARHCLDYDFIYRNPDYKHLVSWIPAQSFNWLDFNMDKPTQSKLFLEGAKEAVRFLRGFDWPQYKAIRQGLAVAARAQATPGQVQPSTAAGAGGM